MDLFDLKSRGPARSLVDLRLRSSVLNGDDESEEKRAGGAVRSNRSRTKTLASGGKELKDNFLRALAEREEANRSGKITSIIFIRDHNTLGQEVSGYIDYAHRLRTQDFEPYFSGKKRLVPGRSDLCYYNWKTQVSTSSSSPNFEVIYDDPRGLLFRNKRDKKILSVDPSCGPGEDSIRTLLHSDLYVHVVIYDHNIRTL
ncbi:cilia- and flagella-associated protein 299 [Labrus mixtus]|uniref:cilia- and flagella-associated protein 299 n=1 Tax=Labrus mixtus TaxID=508554 RepID=UPI0029C074D5|nr:cilia- and flagella-associated protein 299 [Labrus mixtus]